jgi:hypothetical protein
MSGGVWREWALVSLAAAGCAGENSQQDSNLSAAVVRKARSSQVPELARIPGGRGPTRASPCWG